MIAARANRWLTLLIAARLLATAGAVALLLLHRVTDDDGMLLAAGLAYTAITLAAFSSSSRLQTSRAAWTLDTAAALWLVYASEDWRSPFYILAITTLILPATTLRFRHGIAWSAGFTVAYIVVATLIRLDSQDLETSVSLEVLATHLMVPGLVALALAYAAHTLRRLAEERRRAERLAVQSERQRIAWELHDSAKQRVHAAHLLLTFQAGGEGGGVPDELLRQAVDELNAAIGDMDTSVAELRAPLPEGELHDLLKVRAAELRAVTDAAIVVRGRAPALDASTTAHAYRVAAEALTNAVRHARATRIDVELEPLDSDGLRLVVRDDGVGLPETVRTGANGLRSMQNRAQTIGATLAVDGHDAGGTVVTLELPSTDRRKSVA